jgi:hypothetical protein
MGWACNAYGEVKNMYKILVGKSEGKRSLESIILKRIGLIWLRTGICG